MKILCVYASTHGQTRKIVKFMAESTRLSEHALTIHDCDSLDDPPTLADHDAVMLAAPIYHNEYPEKLIKFVASSLAALQSMPTGLVSVSLSVTLADGEQQARAYADGFVDATGLQPDAVHLAEGAVRNFDYTGAEAMTVNLVVFKGQKTMPPRDANPEYTNWDAIEEFAARFVDLAGKQAASGDA